MSLYRSAAFQAITRSQFNKIESNAIHYDWDLAFSGRSRGNEHLGRTVKLVKHLWNLLYKIDNKDKDPKHLTELDIAVAGALLHDIGLVEGNTGHCFTGVKIAGKQLSQIGLADEIIKRILHCIEAHDGEVLAKTVEARLVHDADTIDKLGPLGAVRHIWKLSLLGEEKYRWDELSKIIPEHLDARFNNLYLKEAKEHASKMKDIQNALFADPAIFEKLVSYITESASSGIPVDKLILNIVDNVALDGAIINQIKKQLKPPAGLDKK